MSRTALAVFTLSVAFLLVISTGVIAQDEDYTLKIAEEVGSLGESVPLTVSLDFVDGGALQGYQWGICHDGDLLTLEDGDVENGSYTDDGDSGGPSVSFTFEQIIVYDETESHGWTAGALLNVITGDVLDPTDDAELYVATYEILDVDSTGIALLEWCETLGSPAVTNRVIVDSSELEPILVDGSILVLVSDYLVELTREVGELDCTATVGCLLTNSGDGIEAYEWGVCHDLKVDISDGDITKGIAVEELEFEFHEIVVHEEGWTVCAVFETDPATTLGTGEQLEMYTATYELLNTDISDIDFCDTLGDPVIVPTVVVGGEGAAVDQIRGWIDIATMIPPEFTFEIANVTTSYRPIDGVGSFDVPVSILQDVRGEASACVDSTDGFLLALSHDDSVLTPTGVSISPDLEGLLDDSTPAFLASDLNPANGPGVTVGVLYFLVSGTRVEFDEEVEVVLISYDTVPEALIDDDLGTTTELTWIDGLGEPEVNNAVIMDDDEYAPAEFVDALIALEADLRGLFLRGDVDGNADVFPIVDSVYLLKWGFTNGPAPPCDDAADVDDNGSLLPITDALYLLSYGFTGGEAPPDPGPDKCGPDPTDDEIDCETVSDDCM